MDDIILDEEQIKVLKEAHKAWRIDIDSDHYSEADCGFRTPQWLCPDFYLIFEWDKLTDLMLLETDGAGWYRITESGRQAENSITLF